jgi:hypothetical protein
MESNHFTGCRMLLPSVGSGTDSRLNFLIPIFQHFISINYQNLAAVMLPNKL